LLGLAVSFGLAACKPSSPSATDNLTTAAPSIDASHDAPNASAAQQMAAVADALNPLTSPGDAVMASMRKMTEAQSYHADMHIEGSKIGMRDGTRDFVATDRYRIARADRGTQLVMDGAMSLDIKGRKLKSAAPAAPIQPWRNSAKPDDIAGTMTV
jgi:hypothetical protein